MLTYRRYLYDYSQFPKHENVCSQMCHMCITCVIHMQYMCDTHVIYVSYFSCLFKHLKQAEQRKEVWSKHIITS